MTLPQHGCAGTQLGPGQALLPVPDVQANFLVLLVSLHGGARQAPFQDMHLDDLALSLLRRLPRTMSHSLQEGSESRQVAQGVAALAPSSKLVVLLVWAGCWQH